MGSSGLFGRMSGSLKNLFAEQKATVTLMDCLRKFCETETLTGKEKYECDTCKIRQECKKTILFTDLPEVICFHLKRFRMDNSLQFSSSTKKSTYVQFPLEGLDLSEFMDEEMMEQKHAEYKLIGVVEHSGSLNGGHYI